MVLQLQNLETGVPLHSTSFTLRHLNKIQSKLLLPNYAIRKKKVIAEGEP